MLVFLSLFWPQDPTRIVFAFDSGERGKRECVADGPTQKNTDIKLCWVRKKTF